MPVRGTGIIFDLSVGLAFAVAFFGVGCWIGRQGTQELERWQRCLSDRRTPTGNGWEQLTSLDRAVKLSHANGTANGTTTATARNTTHGTTHTTAYDMTLGAASDTAAGILDGSIQDGTADATTDATEDATAIGNNDITARGAASGPH